MHRISLSFLALSLSLVACADESDCCKPAPAPASGSTSAAVTPSAPPAASGETLESISKAYADARAANDAPRLLALTKAMLITNEDLKKVLRTGAATDAFIAKFNADRIRGDANEAAGELLKPTSAAQTVVRVHSATTEELAAFAPDSVAAKEFPPVMKAFAEQVAAPGRVWQTIEYLEPGQDHGMKFTVFTNVEGRVLFIYKPGKAIDRPK